MPITSAQDVSLDASLQRRKYSKTLLGDRRQLLRALISDPGFCYV